MNGMKRWTLKHSHLHMNLLSNRTTKGAEGEHNTFFHNYAFYRFRQLAWPLLSTGIVPSFIRFEKIEWQLYPLHTCSRLHVTRIEGWTGDIFPAPPGAGQTSSPPTATLPSRSGRLHKHIYNNFFLFSSTSRGIQIMKILSAGLEGWK